LTVPKGANSGQMMRLKGRGLGDGGAGKRGDLLARFMVTLPEQPDADLQAFAEAWRRDRPYSPRRRA
jgi:DnaJ-class molecular chaperone